MLIGQLSAATGFPKDTIRYYEKIELIVVPRNRSGRGGYKDYPHELIDILNSIRHYKELGFTLEEIRQLLIWRQMQVLDLNKMLQVVELKLAGISAEIDKLHEVQLRLNRAHQQLLGKKSGHSISLPEFKLAA